MSLDVRTIRSLVKAQKPGMWAARHGLNLVIANNGAPSWSIRYTNDRGKRRLMKLADYQPIEAASLAALEADAAEHLKAIRAGADPLTERSVSIIQPEAPERETFKDAALTYIAENKPTWKNEKHKQQWESTLATYVYPYIGDKLTHEVTMDDVKRILQQRYASRGKIGTLWTSARETATRVRSRIEIVIKAARAKALADNGNPDRQTLWRNHHNPADNDSLRYAGLNGKQITTNFKAMDWKQLPLFMAGLLGDSDFSAKALALTILCATRSNETFNATWSEIDVDNGVWIVPAERMKMGKEHRIPLSTVAISLLNRTHRIEGNPYVFPGAKRQRPLSNMAMLEKLRGMRPGEGLTVHGFRSAFRDWITETTLHPDAIAEQALAHSIDNKVERAYRRGDAFERRKDLMQQWSDYLTIDQHSYRERWNKFIAI